MIFTVPALLSIFTNPLTAFGDAGTLAAFVAVALCMLVMRRREPARPRPFRAPVPWLLGPLAIAGCVYLFFSLAGITREIFLAWNALGLAVYFLYAHGHSRLGKAPLA